MCSRPMSHRFSADDQAFRRDLEACKLPADCFDHAAHVRLAYIYLCEGSSDDAAARMRTSLLRYLQHLGVGQSRFHETLTRAWVLAIARFMAESPPCASAAAFIQANPRLLDGQILLGHYSAKRLFSTKARASFVEPDLQAFS